MENRTNIFFSASMFAALLFLIAGCKTMQVTLDYTDPQGVPQTKTFTDKSPLPAKTLVSANGECKIEVKATAKKEKVKELWQWSEWTPGAELLLE